MGVKRSNAYEAIAIFAASQEGMDPPTAEGASQLPAARQARDIWWYDYERRLRDEQTFTLDQIHEWLQATFGATCGRTTVHRDRLRLMEPIRRSEMAAAKSKAVVDALGARGSEGLYQANLAMIGQHCFDMLSGFDAEQLSGLDTQQVLRLFDTVGKLAKARAETELTTHKLAELQRQLDERKATADREAATVLRSKDIDEETMNRIRRIYGLPKLAELAT